MAQKERNIYNKNKTHSVFIQSNAYNTYAQFHVLSIFIILIYINSNMYVFSFLSPFLTIDICSSIHASKHPIPSISS